MKVATKYTYGLLAELEIKTNIRWNQGDIPTVPRSKPFDILYLDFIGLAFSSEKYYKSDEQDNYQLVSNEEFVKECGDMAGWKEPVILPIKSALPISLHKPEGTPCPHPEWIGTWFYGCHLIDLQWDSVTGLWSQAWNTDDDRVYPCSHDSNWPGPIVAGWKRPDEMKSPLLPRLKTRINEAYRYRVNIGKAGWSDYEDELT